MYLNPLYKLTKAFWATAKKNSQESNDVYLLYKTNHAQKLP